MQQNNIKLAIKNNHASYLDEMLFDSPNQAKGATPNHKEDDKIHKKIKTLMKIQEEESPAATSIGIKQH